MKIKGFINMFVVMKEAFYTFGNQTFSASVNPIVYDKVSINYDNVFDMDNMNSFIASTKGLYFIFYTVVSSANVFTNFTLQVM